MIGIMHKAFLNAFTSINILFLYKFQLSLFLRVGISSIVWGKSLASNRRRAIIWANDGLVHWRLYASSNQIWSC